MFEKLISGMYLGEIARRLLLRLAREVQLFGAAVPTALLREYGLESRVVAEIDHDETPDLALTGEALSSALGVAKSTRQQRALVQQVCQLVAVRSARLAAAAISGVLKHTGRTCTSPGAPPAEAKAVIAVDGSLFAKYAKYKLSGGGFLLGLPAWLVSGTGIIRQLWGLHHPVAHGAGTCCTRRWRSSVARRAQPAWSCSLCRTGQRLGLPCWPALPSCGTSSMPPAVSRSCRPPEAGFVC